MTKTELKLMKRALSEYSMRRIVAIRALPKYEWEHSREYDDKINAFIESSRIRESGIINRRRILIAAAVLAATLMLVGCCVLGGFIIRDYDNGRGTNFYLSGEGGKETFEEIYMPTVPDEYKFHESKETFAMKSYIWEKGDKQIIFEQCLTENSSVLLDTEYKDYSVIEINGCTIYYISRYDDYVALWLYDGYLFNVMTDGGVTFEEVCDIIESVKVVTDVGSIE